MKASTRQLLVIVIALVGLLLVITFFSKPRESQGPEVESLPNNGQVLDYLPVTPPPPMTESMKRVFEASKGFNALISFTDNGFEPANITIKKGQTIRFTNNSSKDMWIAAGGDGGNVYPDTGEGCGESALDTCGPLAPNEIWELTFDYSGTWSYRNNSNREFTGVIRVE